MADGEDPDFDVLESRIAGFESPSESESAVGSSDSPIEPAATAQPRLKRRRFAHESKDDERVERAFVLDDVHRMLMQEQRQNTAAFLERLAAMNDDGDVVHLRSNTIVQSVGHVQALPMGRGQRYFEEVDDDDEEEELSDESDIGEPNSVAAIFRELCIEDTPVTDEIVSLLSRSFRSVTYID